MKRSRRSASAPTRIPAMWAAAVVPLAATASPAFSQPQPWVPASAEVSIGIGDGSPLGSLDLFLPLARGQNNLLFGDVRAFFSTDQDVTQASLGFGYRASVGETWTLGINGYYDYMRSDYDNDFHQLGIGVEALSQDWELRANGYLPLGDVAKSVEAYNAAVIEYDRLMFRAGEETAMRGFNGEVGYRLPVFDADDLSQLKLFGGGYWFTGDRVEDVPGVAARVEFSRADLPHLGAGSRLTLVAGISYDDQRDFDTTLLARLRVPLGSSEGMAPEDPFYRRVERFDEIRTHVGTTGKAEAAVLVETGTTVGEVININGQQTAAGINAEIAAAGEGALVLASGTIDLETTMRLGTGTILTTGGRTFAVRGANSGQTALFTVGGGPATLNGTNVAADVVALGDRSTVSNLAITGGRDGISAANVENALVQNVTISGAARHGISASGVNGLQIDNTRMSALGGSGLSASGASNLRVNALGIAGAAGSGLVLNNVTNSAFSNVDASLTGGANGIVANGVTDVSFSGVSVSGRVGSGFVADGANNVTVSNLSLSGVSGSGIALTNASGISFDGVGISATSAVAPFFAMRAMAAAPANGGIVLTNVDSAQFSNVALSLTGGDGIALDNASNVQFSNVAFTGEISNAFTALGGGNIGVNGLRIAQANGSGIVLSSVDGARFSNVDVALAGGDAVVIDGGSNLSFADVGFTGTAGNALTASNTAGLSVNGLTVASVTGNGLALTDVNGATLANLDLTLNGGDGVNVNGGSDIQLVNVALQGEVANALTATDTTGLGVNGLAVSSVAGNGLALTDVNGATLANLDLTLNGGDGVNVSGGSDIQLANVALQGKVANALTATSTTGVGVNGFTVASVTGNGLALTDVNGATLANLDLTLNGGDGVNVSGGSDVQLANVVLQGEVANAFTAINTAGLGVNGLAVASATGNGLALADVDGAQFSNVTLTMNGGADAITGTRVDNLRIDNVGISGSFANGVSLTDVNNVVIDTASIAGGTGHGVVATGANGLAVNGAQISDVGGDGIFVTDSSNLEIANSDISATGSHGVQLENVNGALIASTRIHNLARCEDNTDCEWSIFNPNVVYNAGISALGVQNLTVRDVAMEDVTYGLFVGSTYEEIDWENTIVAQSENITVDNLSIVNNRREGVLLVGVETASLTGISIDATAMDRSMDLIVLQKSAHITLDTLDLKGGINGLMFASSFNLPGATTDISVSNVRIADTFRAGVFMNPTTDVRFSNVDIFNPGSYGFHLYGDAYGFAGGPISDISFTDVSVNNSTEAAIYVTGPINNFNGNIATENVPAACSADGGSWSGTKLTQDPGLQFSIGGAVVPVGQFTANCGL